MDGTLCSDVLSNAATLFETEWWIEGYAINLCKREVNVTPKKLLQSNVPGANMTEIELIPATDSQQVTRLYPRGSEKNNASGKKLQLDSIYIDAPGASLIIEEVKEFPDIYPRHKGMVGTVRVSTGGFYFFEDTTLGFNPNDYEISGLTKKITFSTGELAGLEFDCNWHANDSEFELIAYEYTTGVTIPNATGFAPVAGDEYILWNITMPAAYTTAAKAELLVAAQDYLSEFSSPKISCNLTQNLVAWMNDNTRIQMGEIVTIKKPHTMLSAGRDIRVSSYKNYLNRPNKYDSIVVADLPTIGKLTTITNVVTATKTVVNNAGLAAPSYTARRWRDSVELTSKIKALQAQLLLIGDEAGQFDTTMRWQANYMGVPADLHIAPGTLTHTIYPKPAGGGVWTFTDNILSAIDNAKAYYLYAVCSKMAGTGTLILSDIELSTDDVSDYRFLIGVLSSLNGSLRTFQTVYGFTEISGNEITTGIIKSKTGKAVMNLDDEEISGRFNFKDGLISSLIALASGTTITAGMQGDSAVNLGMWLGGTYQNALDKLAKIILNKDGSGQLAGGKINWDAAGRMNVGFFTVFENLLSALHISFVDAAIESLDSIGGTSSIPTINSLFSTNGLHSETFTAKEGSFLFEESTPFIVDKESTCEFNVAVSANSNCDSFTAILYITDANGNLLYSEQYDGIGGDEHIYIVNTILQPNSYYAHVFMSGFKIEDVFVTDYIMQCVVKSKNNITGLEGGTLYIQPLAARSKFGNNGFYSYWGMDKYFYLSLDYGAELRFGLYGQRWMTTGITKTTNGGATWTNL